MEVFVEPFAGSLAVLLASQPHKREVVCDTDGGICNFWRALQADPDAVAHWADWPTIHDDLTARHRYLVKWVQEHGERLREDPEYYDARAAGWWVWGISLWIGGGWCQPNYRNEAAPDRRPFVSPHTGETEHGKGVSVQRETLPVRDGVRPAIPGGGHTTGAGVAMQRHTLPVGDGKRPMVRSVEGSAGGIGVSAQRTAYPVGDGKMPHIQACSPTAGRGVSQQRGARLQPWLRALSDRLKGVIVLNRSWESAVTTSVLAQTETGPKPPVGILLDPPYLTAERASDVYGSDADGTSDDVARDAFGWAVLHGDRYRIAYCAHEGDFNVPSGWTAQTETFAGIRDAKRRDRRDLIMFSPACVPTSQGRLWGAE